ncbi:MAG: hypothetical protein ACLSVD_14985 [Eggerthellaceae bacterium]
MAFVQVHHDPDVLEVRVPFQNISTNDTNCYIVKDGDETLVIDTSAVGRGLRYPRCCVDRARCRPHADALLPHAPASRPCGLVDPWRCPARSCT